MKLGGGKEWFDASELAELKLPGLPRTKRKINERAAGESWALRIGDKGEPLARPRQRRGGGLEYHLSVLPASARAALAARGITAIADVSDVPETRAAGMWRRYEGLSDKAKAEAKRRLAAIGAVESYERAGLTRTLAVAAVAGRSDIGGSTLWGWFKLIDGVGVADRLPYLAPARRGGGAEADVDPDLWLILISDYLRPERPTFSSCYARLTGIAADRGLPLPHERTLRRKLDREVDQRLVVARRQGADALRRTLPAQERTVAELHAMEAVNIDGHKFDVFVRWPDGRIGRPLMVAIQDIFSSKFLAWRVEESESALATRLTFAQLFQKWGIPRICVLDNGRAFASKWISGGSKTRFRFKYKDDEPLGLLAALGVQQVWTYPYRGQSKPIERAFRDLADWIARSPACAGAWTGNRPDAKPENYGNRAIPIEEFRAIVDQGMAAFNAKLGRRGETANGGSYDAAFAQSYAVSKIGQATEEHLRQALLTAEHRRCDKKTGEVTLDGNRYWTDELARHAGETVTLRFDPDDLHQPVHVYSRDGKFIATAPVIAAVGFFDKAAAKAKAKQEADLRRRMREIAAEHDLMQADQLARLMPNRPAETPPAPRVVRPVRHRGQTAAALKPVQEAVETPLSPQPIDRLAAAAKRLRVVE